MIVTLEKLRLTWGLECFKGRYDTFWRNL